MKTKNLFITRVFLVIIAFFTSSCEGNKNSDNPLLDTQWSGIAKIPVESEVILKFSKDQIDVIFENKIIESMKYTMKGNLINLSKISGGSPCEANSKGTYSYEIIGDKLTMTTVDDECANRTRSLKGEVYTKMDLDNK